MKTVISDIRKHSVIKENKYFFDTMIWLYIFYPDYTNAYRRNLNRDYSWFYKQMVQYNHPYYINIIIISEFVNRYARNEHKRINPGLDFKKFRGTEEYKKVACTIMTICKIILSKAVYDNFNISNQSLDDSLAEFGKDQRDMNDILIKTTCVKNDFILVTHDFDLCDCGLRVLTTNKTLLQQAGVANAP